MMDSRSNEMDTGDPVNRTLPADLPRAAKLFWSTHPEFEKLETYRTPAPSKVLDVLGPPPFPKAGFPFMGFLATVYEHVATHVGVEVEVGVGVESGSASSSDRHG